MITIHLKHKPQTCSYCKKWILHPDDELKVHYKYRKILCKCPPSDGYYVEHNIESDRSGHARPDISDEENYAFRKFDQEHSA